MRALIHAAALVALIVVVHLLTVAAYSPPVWWHEAKRAPEPEPVYIQRNVAAVRRTF